MTAYPITTLKIERPIAAPQNGLAVPVWATPPHQLPPSPRRLPAWRLLRTIRLDDETALPLGWQWDPRLINRSGDQRFHVGMCQLAGRLQLDEASLLSRSSQKPV